MKSRKGKFCEGALWRFDGDQGDAAAKSEPEEASGGAEFEDDWGPRGGQVRGVLRVAGGQAECARAGGAAEVVDAGVGVARRGFHAVHVLGHDDPVRGCARAHAGCQSERRVLDRGVHGGEHEAPGRVQCAQARRLPLRAFHDVRAARRASRAKVRKQSILYNSRPRNLIHSVFLISSSSSDVRKGAKNLHPMKP
jgi:hypothetical protein